MSITPEELAEWRREWERDLNSGVYQETVKNALRLLNAYEAQQKRIAELEKESANLKVHIM